jgi:BirA family transcriptional regulator, biotin operon repressor / biotin---[acetyl-CoA-carboxylase] ligase
METLFIGKNLIRLKRVDSTNNYAASLLRHSGRNDEKKIYDGTIVIADFQEKGKGQRGNSWESEKGKNLTFTLILRPSFLKADQQFLLNKITSLAICDLLKSFGIGNISVKWPNDVLVNGKKIAGILIENTIRSNEIIHSIIGIGLNVNQDKFPKTPNAISLKNFSGKDFSPGLCLDLLCSFLEARYLKLKTNTASADKDYIDSLYRLNEWKDYLVKEEKIHSAITGVTPHGFLRLRKENGSEILCDLKEVVFL